MEFLKRGTTVLWGWGNLKAKFTRIFYLMTIIRAQYMFCVPRTGLWRTNLDFFLSCELKINKLGLKFPPGSETSQFFFLIMRIVGRACLVAQTVKNLPATQETRVIIPGSGRSPGGPHGKPLQYSCLENSMDWGVWQATAHGTAKSRTRLSN